MRLLTLVLTLVLILGGLGAAALRLPAVQDPLIERVIRARMDTTSREALFADDALRLLVCGSASPFPDPDRARPCLTVIAGGKFYVVDTGPGSWNRMALLRIPPERIGAVLISHLHSDHIGDLGEFNLQTWVAGRSAPLDVYGPKGVERLVAGMSEAYALDTDYRIAHHGAHFLDRATSQMQARPLQLAADGGLATVLEDGELRISVFPVSHEPIEPAVGYRFDYKGRSIVISGDTRKDLNLARMARGADLLAHEAQAQHMVAQIGAVAKDLGRDRYATVMADIPDYHTSPVEAAEIANAAEVPLLLMYHLTPPPPNRVAEWALLRGVKKVRPDGVLLAEDGQLIELPLDGGAARVSVLK